ncbi:GxxExxY protein [Chryseobacterium indoltheticum]|uniref:GxxExxY protein n=1 Tax=Chryseobacterium indoltheticum TaxID=254 RepID=UPI003F494158
MTENEISNLVFDAGMKVHRKLGVGLYENKVIIEIKAVPELNSYHFYQILNYLRITEMKLGMILNFHSKLFKDGVKRVVNKL